MAHCFTEVSEEEIKTAFCYPSDLATIRVGEEWWIHTLTLRISVYIHHYSAPLQGIVVCYSWCSFYMSVCSTYHHTDPILCKVFLKFCLSLRGGLV